MLSLEDADSSLQNIMKYLTSSDNLRACKATTGASGDLDVALVKIGKHLISAADTSKLSEKEWIVKWITNGIAVISFLGTSISLNSVLEFETLCAELQTRSDLGALVLLVPKNITGDFGSERLVQEAIVSLSFEGNVTAIHRLALVSHNTVASFCVPVSAVLDGPIVGFQASLAFASDWRIPTIGTSLHVSDEVGFDPFQVHEKATSLCRQDKQVLPHILDERKMLDTNLISSCTPTFEEAVEIAEQLAVTMATSPSDGVANTLRLFVLSFRRDQS